jgi:hypothetical protein
MFQRGPESGKLEFEGGAMTSDEGIIIRREFNLWEQDHGEERSADAASWRGPDGGRRRRASDPFRIHATTSHAYTARSRIRPILYL